jgi:hypothetical protein
MQIIDVHGYEHSFSNVAPRPSLFRLPVAKWLAGGGAGDYDSHCR